ncbi:MAG: hypothetical protein A3B47_00275 [Candidatus Levybacteria bacterium RIFCSPLOWO2_01_FULL_39_24]|nr:MAG: hypothetical protein A2800_00915 [Candidatus Levybacteria bacterium RIFCSPHIGHO2_01_FULL_40_16]OGH46212.1 MAG: hypothetical protein A3B47_00275 [Candidatus Levybacteria bacterium RIFCSPLOWO2_01_FULL_39_24]
MTRALLENKIIKKTSDILHNRIIVWIVIPFLLLVFWIFLSYRYIASKTGVTVLTYPSNANNYTSWKTTELLKGEKIKGQFIASDNHLGIVAVRFSTFSRINKDAVIFRIKNIKSKNWLYEHSYLVNQFQDNQYFTFGMPIFDNSFKETYQFEIESVRGKPKDAIALSRKEPVFVTKYKFPKKEILDKNILMKFIFMKTTESLLDNDFIASSTIYLLPFLFYFTAMIIFLGAHSYLKNNSLKRLFIYLPLYLILLCALIAVVLAKTIYPLMIIIVVVLWMSAIIRYRFKGRVTIIFGSACLLISPFLLLFSFLREAINITIWAYVFLVIATVQSLVELKLVKKR